MLTWGKCLADVYSGVNGNVTICWVITTWVGPVLRDGSKTGLATPAVLKLHIADNNASGSGEGTKGRTVRDCGMRVIRFKYFIELEQ